jgi:hypothetical protein
MNDFLGLLGNWHFWALVAGYWFLTASIGALPMPDVTSSKFYGWFFKMSNTFAGNLSRAVAGKIPGTQDVMPLPGAQDAVNKVAVVAKAVDVLTTPEKKEP